MNMFHHGPECSAFKTKINPRQAPNVEHLVSNDCSILSGLPKNMVQLSSVSKVQRSGTLDNIVYPNVMSSQGRRSRFKRREDILIAILTIWSLPTVGEDEFGIWTLWHSPDLTVGGIWPTCEACDVTTLFVTITFPACSISAGLNWIWSRRWKICVVGSLQRALTKWYAVGWY